MYTRKLFTAAFVVSSALLWIAAQPVQGGTVLAYAVDTSTNLDLVNLTTTTSTVIGNTGQFFEGLALSPGGVLFGTTSGGDLFTINTATGAASFVGTTGLGNIEGLTFNGNTLVGSNFSNPATLYTIDTTTAAVTPLVTTSPAEGVFRGMTVQNSNTALALSDSPLFQSLISINLTSGATSVLGSVITSGGVYGLGFGSDGILYALGMSGQEYTIDPTTGAATLVGATGKNEFFLDMAIQPSVASTVPEMDASTALSAVALLGMGVTLVNARRKRAA